MGESIIMAKSQKTTYALVVGIERYGEKVFPDLDGAALDAQKFYDWLVKRGVQKENIRLHLAPLEQNKAEVNPDVPLATRSALEASITDWLGEKAGDLLWVYWGGHGVINVENKRCLFTSDVTEKVYRSLELNELLRYLRTTSFSRQIFCIDACANFLSPEESGKIQKTELPEGELQKNVAQSVLLAVEAGQKTGHNNRLKTGDFSEALRNELEKVTEKEWPPNIKGISQKIKSSLKQDSVFLAYGNHEELEAQIYNFGIAYSRSKQNNFLRQRYLKNLVEQVGTLNLALINPKQSGKINLEEVYVDSPTPLEINFEVEAGKVVDLWMSRTDQLSREIEEGRLSQPRSTLEELGYERAPFETLVGKINIKQAQSRRENSIKLHLNHLAAARDRLVILGAPGSGKSTFVKYLALCLAGAGIEKWQRKANLAELENWPHGALTPIYIELRRFVTWSHFPKSGAVSADHLWAYVVKELLGEELQGYADDLKNDLQEGQAVLLLDGLDEVPFEEGKLKERQEQLIGLVESLHKLYWGSRVIVTSRPSAYEGWSLPGFEAVTITAFEDSHRLKLVEKLYRASKMSGAEAQAKAAALNEQLEEIDLELKDRPLFVTLMATLYLKDEGGLPTRKGTLYRESILLLLDQWTKNKAEGPSLLKILGDKRVEELYVRLAALAYAVHDSSGVGERTAEISVGQLVEYLKPFGRHVRMDIINYLCENAGVLVAPGQRRGEEEVFHFAHRTFQEYLAAAHLVGEYEKEESFSKVGEVIVGKPETWRVPCAFVGDVLTDTGRKVDLWQLLGELLEEEPPSEGSDPRWWLGWLGATIAQEQELYAQKKLNKLTEQPIRDALVKWLVALLETSQALQPVERAYCGRVLGLLGDSRKGVGLRPDGLPDIGWCPISAPLDGKFVMGEKGREVPLSHSYQMSKYQITYGQYQSFVDSGEYEQSEWWRDFPKGYQPQEIGGQYNEYRNHPRDNVSWYQAVGFCRWLTVKYRAIGVKAGGIEANEEIRLPTEEEWEYAARGQKELKYPYGNDFDKNKGNTDETGIGSSSAVGCYPDGASPFGLLDMSGNVYEWCLNKYDNPKEIGVDDSDARRVLRGGSYHVSRVDASCVYRSLNVPYLDFDLVVGFRVAVLSALSRPSDL